MIESTIIEGNISSLLQQYLPNSRNLVEMRSVVMLACIDPKGMFFFSPTTYSTKAYQKSLLSTSLRFPPYSPFPIRSLPVAPVRFRTRCPSSKHRYHQYQKVSSYFPPLTSNILSRLRKSTLPRIRATEVYS